MIFLVYLEYIFHVQLIALWAPIIWKLALQIFFMAGGEGGTKEHCEPRPTSVYTESFITKFNKQYLPFSQTSPLHELFGIYVRNITATNSNRFF